MDEKRRTLAAWTILIGFFVLVAIVIGIFVSSSKIVSPVPEESAIKIIFISPTPSIINSPSLGASPLPSATR